jgi:hypothetical protein
MRKNLLISALFCLAGSAAVTAAPPVALEIATERGVQITAPQEWLQLLAGIGIEQVRIRGMEPGDEPRATNAGSPQRPSYRVLGIITTRDQLRLPGGTFGPGDRAKLKDYFDRLSADGAESLTAARGRFGLTEKELTAAFADLSQSIDFETKGQQPRAVLDQLQKERPGKFEIDPAADNALQDAKPIADEVKGISTGTALAMILRPCGLVMRPEKLRGQAVSYRIVTADADAASQSTLGKTSSADPNQKNWPIGWEPEKSPGEVAPSLLETLNAEIGGYSLEEAIGAISPRLKLPLYIDHASLAAHKIDLAKTQIKLPRARMSYKRLLDRVFTQAHLGCSIRTDESGAAFLWVTR